ncbi:DUF6777 domain-containing protein [Streptomyces sp. MUM 178J]|uniref:DUF6777 domain-containing protein n=1 Tax=Streptomyces sp. MUM 178J TaxID=2791991 RepID=UPI001F044AFB|nr:DUF6777 domain-containing protein [Streptomyces sp. MUM 178J]WRQ78126.1 DUF6777 domain-containing protein [Streptomyces sp. MUM 178J]
MSSQPPSSDRPTGPPSGPLSGPSQEGPTQQSPTPPPASTPPEPPGGPGGGGPGGGGGGGEGGGPAGGPGKGPGRPWWRSVPIVAGIAAAVVVAAVLAVVLSGGGGDAEDEVFLQAAGSTGPDPFTESSTEASPSAPPPPSPASPEEDDGQVTRTVDGSEPGLYGGTRNVPSCDVEQQIRYLTDQPDKNQAFASVLDIQPDAVPDYLRSLTPVQLRADTRVTNHGYKDGEATSYQAVLQAGTAVLVDDRGVPRVRCACGNPLTPPQALQGSVQRRGDSWPGYSPSNTVAVTPSTTVVNVFILFDFENGEWFARDKGDTGEKDRPTTPPSPDESPSPTDSPTSPTPTESPTGSPTETPATETPGTETPATETPVEPTEDVGPTDGTGTYGPPAASPDGAARTSAASYGLPVSPGV